MFTYKRLVFKRNREGNKLSQRGHRIFDEFADSVDSFISEKDEIFVKIFKENLGARRIPDHLPDNLLYLSHYQLKGMLGALRDPKTYRRFNTPAEKAKLMSLTLLAKFTYRFKTFTKELEKGRIPRISKRFLKGCPWKYLNYLHRALSYAIKREKNNRKLQKLQRLQHSVESEGVLRKS